MMSMWTADSDVDYLFATGNGDRYEPEQTEERDLEYDAWLAANGHMDPIVEEETP